MNSSSCYSRRFRSRSRRKNRSEKAEKKPKTSIATACELGCYKYEASTSVGAKKKAESHQDPTWRADAKESLYDWTINVTYEGGNGAQTNVIPYHVHKAVLGAGKYRSEYFQALFKSDMNHCRDGNFYKLHLIIIFFSGGVYQNA